MTERTVTGVKPTDPKCPYCGYPKLLHEYTSPTNCVVTSQEDEMSERTGVMEQQTAEATEGTVS